MQKSHYYNSLLFLILILAIIYFPGCKGVYESAKEPGPKITYESTEEGNWEIFIVGLDGSNKKNLTNHPALDRKPNFSPDGSLIVFESWRDANSEIYIMDTFGQNVRNISNHSATDTEPTFTPDGNNIVFTSNRIGNRDIFSINPDGSELTNLTNSVEDEFSPGISPNGEYITYTKKYNWTGQIFSMTLAGTNKINLTNNLSFAEELSQYNSYGNRVAFLFSKNLSWGIYIRDSDGSNREEIIRPPFINSPFKFNFDFNSDDSRIVFEYPGEREGVQIMEPDIYIKDLAVAAHEKNITKSPNEWNFFPRFIDDDNYIVYIAESEKSSSIRKINIDGTEEKIITMIYGGCYYFSIQ